MCVKKKKFITQIKIWNFIITSVSPCAPFHPETAAFCSLCSRVFCVLRLRVQYGLFAVRSHPHVSVVWCQVLFPCTNGVQRVRCSVGGHWIVGNCCEWGCWVVLGACAARAARSEGRCSCKNYQTISQSDTLLPLAPCPCQECLLKYFFNWVFVFLLLTCRISFSVLGIILLFGKYIANILSHTLSSFFYLFPPPPQILNFLFCIGVCRQLTMLWLFQVDSKGTQPYICMYPFFPKLPLFYFLNIIFWWAVF